MWEDNTEPIYKSPYIDYMEMTGAKTSSEMIDSIFTQYLLMLGEFEILEKEAISSYPELSRHLIWIFFFLATMFTNVVFFNTLVAVIGEAYTNLWSFKDRFAML